jgi:tetratricopeptide (TPR) repeat protein
MGRQSRSRRLLALLVVTVTLVGGVACSQSPEAKKQKAVERATAYIKDGKANEAIIELRNALQIDKDYVPALRALGRAYASKAWHADAARELGRAQQLAPDDMEIAGELARSQVELGQWKQVEEQADLILAKSPRNALGLYLRAIARLGIGKPQEALALADEAAKGEGGLPADLPPVRAEALVRLNKLAEADQAYRAALAANPKDRRVLAGLAALEFRRTRFEEAKKLYAEAHALAPQDPRVRLGLAATTAVLGDVKGAIKILEGVDMRARNVGVLVALGKYYLLDNRPNDAIAVLSPVVARAPQLVDARLLLAAAYLAANSPQQAIGHLEDMRKTAPNSPALQFRLAQAYNRVGRFKDGLALLDASAKAFEKAPGYHLERARSLFFLGRADEAYREASVAQTLAPQSAQPLLLMGQMKAQQGDARAAQDLFTKAAQLDQGSIPARLALGRLRASEQDMEGALAEFDTATKVDPKSVAAARIKAAALIQQNRLREAVHYAEAAVKAEPSVPGLYGVLAAVYARDNQVEKARGALQKQLELAPRSVDARVGLARLAIRQQKDEEAMSQLQAAVKDHPDHLGAVFLLASLAEKLGRYEQGVAPLEAAVKANPNQPPLVLVLAKLRLRIGQNDAVIAETTELLRRYPEMQIALPLRAQAYIAKRDGEAALRDLTQLARARPKEAGPQYLLGHTYAMMGRVPEAEAAYKETLKLNPKHEAARQELAMLSGGKPDPAVLAQRVETARTQVNRDPRDVEARERLAQSLLANNQSKEAEAEIKALLDMAPTHLGGNLLMARLRFEQGRADDAVTHLRAALRTNPNNLEANMILARYLYRQNRREEARPLLERALRVNPNIPDVKFDLGVLYAQTGRYQDAMRLVDELAKSHPKSPLPPTLKGQILLAQRNVKPAADAFSAAIALGGNVAAAHRGLAQTLEAQGLTDRAIEHYRKALAQSNDVIALNNLAWLLVEKQPDEALALATKAHELAPRSGEVADTLGWIHYRRGAYLDAEKALAQAEQQSPGNAQIKYHLGLTYAKLGKKTDAVSTLRRAAQIDPKLAQSAKIADLIKELGG